MRMIVTSLLEYLSLPDLRKITGKLLKSMAALMTICAITCAAHSQTTIKSVLSAQESSYSKSILELLMNLDEINPGTKIAPTVKTAFARDTSFRRSEEDSTRQENSILLVEDNELIKIKLELKNDKQRVEISAFNMLGKKVNVFYNDYALKSGEWYTFPTSVLPNGIYLCIVQGQNFLLKEKFSVSR